MTIVNNTDRPVRIKAKGDTGDHVYQPGEIRTADVRGSSWAVELTEAGADRRA